MTKLMTVVVVILAVGGVAFAADVAAGKVAYKMECEECHKANGAPVGSVDKSMKGKGVTMRDLKAPEVQSQTDAQWKKTILEGSGKMKGAKIDAASVDNIIAFMRTLKK